MLPVSKAEFIRKSLPQRPNLVFVRCGKRSLLSEWFRSNRERDWDLMLSFYEAVDEDSWPIDAEFIANGGVSKFTSVSELHAEDPTCFISYKAILFLDDDIELKFDDLNSLFGIFSEYELDLAQPSLTEDSFASWTITKFVEQSILRFTNFVEVMMPIMSSRAFITCLPTFSKSYSSWGIDYVWPKLLEYPREKIAIIDRIKVRHSQPINRVSGRFYTYLADLGIDPVSESLKILAEYQIEIDAVRHPVTLGTIHQPSGHPGLSLTSPTLKISEGISKVGDSAVSSGVVFRDSSDATEPKGKHELKHLNKVTIDSTKAITDLCVLATEFPTDKSPYCYLPGKGAHRHPYTAVYDLLFGFRRFEELTVGELGILDNMSMHAWRSYFPNATLFGFDAFQDKINSAEQDGLANVYYHLADVTSQKSMLNAFNISRAKFDILIDDSTHLFPHQINFIAVALQFVKPGGFIIVEDVFRGWDELRYLEALKPYASYLSSGTFIECNHSNAYSVGITEPYFDNDKLLVLTRNSNNFDLPRPPLADSRKLLDHALNSETFRSKAGALPGTPQNRSSGVSELGLITAIETVSPIQDTAALETSTIYVVSHLIEKRLPDIPGLTAILVGAAAANARPEALTDKLKNGDSLLNKRWSELSAIYKIWQNGPKTETVGFCHYRRYLCFSEELTSLPKYTISEPELFSLSKAFIPLINASSLEKRTLYVPQETKLPGTVYQTYSLWHSGKDFLNMFRIACLAFPDLGEVIASQFERTEFYACNLFVLSWLDFDDLCRHWFKILGDFVSQAEWPRENAYQDRDVSFLSERIFDAWVRSKERSGYKLVKLPTVYVE